LSVRVLGLRPAPLRWDNAAFMVGGKKDQKVAVVSCWICLLSAVQFQAQRSALSSHFMVAAGLGGVDAQQELAF
jgi:hypothetical protein